MEKMLRPCDKEHMKMAMLKHEQTFKQQVYELHRLYRIQKTLMKGVSNNRLNGSNQRRLNCGSEISLSQMNGNRSSFHQKPRPVFNLDQPVEAYITETNEPGETEIEDESEIQLTLGPTKYTARKKTETSDSGPSFSSSSTGSSHNKAAHIGPDQNTGTLARPAWGLTMLTADSKSGSCGGRKSGFGVEDRSKQGRINQPPWLLQALSLNMS